MRSPASVIEAQLEAYNRRDIDAFAATYAPDVRILIPTNPDLPWLESRRSGKYSDKRPSPKPG